MLMVGHGNKVDIHQPFAEPGHVLAELRYHIGFVVNGIVGVFQHLGQAYLGLRILLLELAQNGKRQAAARKMESTTRSSRVPVRCEVRASQRTKRLSAAVSPG
jgi:hypothetical protein